ncbi:MAG TPA: non-canonical purine NTP pyrophosphatase [Tepidisphaeraceae bacterium]|jgi:inosine/xanthosine triphosphate pyrophosphatase family protein|nr:non-canonical purine NTP pyrophosphatase [Tepidisphaeraceae bacterium]
MASPITVVYVTTSNFKEEECKLIVEHCTLPSGSPVKGNFEFDFRKEPIPETLEVNIEQMVRAEVRAAYSKFRIPCIVEHAGLIFENYRAVWYPGGLTKPMWNTLGQDFVKETASANRPATARAVIAYCDGMNTRTFTGETTGKIADGPRGSRTFYWDTVFVPDDPDGTLGTKTYAEINDDPALGLRYKVTKLSQSTKAMLGLLSYLETHSVGALWRQ